MKLCSIVPNFYIHISVSSLYPQSLNIIHLGYIQKGSILSHLAAFQPTGLHYTSHPQRLRTSHPSRLHFIHFCTLATPYISYTKIYITSLKVKFHPRRGFTIHLIHKGYSTSLYATFHPPGLHYTSHPHWLHCIPIGTISST
jgi:hypothetical protein